MEKGSGGKKRFSVTGLFFARDDQGKATASKRTAFAAVIGTLVASGIFLDPGQMGGVISKTAMSVMHSRDCHELFKKYENYALEDTVTDTHDFPIIGRHWWTESTETPGRIDLHVSVNPPVVKSTDEMAGLIFGKAGTRQDYAIEGLPNQENEYYVPPDDGECTPWWIPRGFAEDGNARPQEWIFEGLHPQRKYCLTMSVATGFEGLGTTAEASSKLTCFKAEWNIDWGLAWG